VKKVHGQDVTVNSGINHFAFMRLGPALRKLKALIRVYEDRYSFHGKTWWNLYRIILIMPRSPFALRFSEGGKESASFVLSILTSTVSNED
jgi:hypothetical protein